MMFNVIYIFVIFINYLVNYFDGISDGLLYKSFGKGKLKGIFH